MPSAERYAAIQPNYIECKVILATNAAESSLTIQNARYVVDTGLCKQNFRTERGEQLGIFYTSQHSATQRAGRVGRQGPGAVIRLYDRTRYDSLPATSMEVVPRTATSSPNYGAPLHALVLGAIKLFDAIEPVLNIINPLTHEEVDATVESLTASAMITQERYWNFETDRYDRTVKVTPSGMIVHAYLLEMDAFENDAFFETTTFGQICENLRRLGNNGAMYAHGFKEWRNEFRKDNDMWPTVQAEANQPPPPLPPTPPLPPPPPPLGGHAHGLPGALVLHTSHNQSRRIECPFYGWFTVPLNGSGVTNLYTINFDSRVYHTPQYGDAKGIQWVRFEVTENLEKYPWIEQERLALRNHLTQQGVITNDPIDIYHVAECKWAWRGPNEEELSADNQHLRYSNGYCNEGCRTGWEGHSKPHSYWGLRDFGNAANRAENNYYETPAILTSKALYPESATGHANKKVTYITPTPQREGLGWGEVAWEVVYITHIWVRVNDLPSATELLTLTL